jgi:hypothetical protein
MLPAPSLGEHGKRYERHQCCIHALDRDQVVDAVEELAGKHRLG